MEIVRESFFAHLQQFGDLPALIVGEETIPYSALARGEGPLELVRCLYAGKPYAPVSPRLPPQQQDLQRQVLATVPTEFATALYTSGSTGTPKIAVHSLDNHWANALGSNSNIPLKPGDRWALSLPLYHVGGLGILFRCFVAGATAVMAVNGVNDLSTFTTANRITHLSLVHTQLRRLLENPVPRSVSAILLGGSAIPEDLLARGDHLPLYRSYGLTEMCSQVATTKAAAPRSSGHLLPHRELKIIDGEICVRGRTLFAGYWREGKLDRARDADGWFHTKDLGYIDSTGGLHVTGRRDNLFISGGENIQPEEIEAALLNLPGVEQAIVVPIADIEFGHRPVAFVQTADGTLPNIGPLRDRLPRFKLPVRLLPLPEQSSGIKPSRHKLIELAAASEPLS